MKKNNYIAILLCVFSCNILFLSCEKTLEINPGNIDRKLSIICNQYFDNMISVNVSVSDIIFSDQPILFPEDAEVDLFEDGVFVERLVYKPKNDSINFGNYYGNTKLAQGKTYTLKAYQKDFGYIEATDIMPLRAEVSAVINKKFPLVEGETFKSQYSYTIQDDPNEKNYYFVQVHYNYLLPGTVDTLTGDTSYYWQGYGASEISSSVSGINLGYRVLFSDETFNGQAKKLTVSDRSPNGARAKEINSWVEVAAISEVFYLYTKSAFELQNSIDEPFALFSNVKNGYGHFMCFNSEFHYIKIK